MSKFLTYYKGIPIYLGDSGCYVVEDGNKEFWFPTETEAIEHIEEQLQKYAEED